MDARRALTIGPAPSSLPISGTSSPQQAGGSVGTSVSLEEVFSMASEHGEDAEMVWSLKFDTAAYWGRSNTFFPEVEIRFFVRGPEAEHYHVPLLLGPWSYTTYRGS